MPAPLAPQVRESILSDIRAGTKSARAIAREHSVSPSTVSLLGREVSEDAFGRSQTKKATEAVVADSAALRAATSRRFLVKCNELLDQMDEPFLAYSFGGRENTYNEHHFGRPPVDAVRTMMTSAAIAFDKHMAQEKLDSTGIEGSSSVDAWLAAMTDGAGH